MENKLEIRPMDLVYFNGHQGPNTTVKLKDIINFLKYIRVPRPFKFSYLEKSDNLIANLTLRENLYLDAISSTLTKDKKFRLDQYLNEKGNQHLRELFLNIGNLDILPNQASIEQRKLTALVRAFLMNSDYIILESPEYGLSTQNHFLFITALKFQIFTQKQVAIISSQSTTTWEKHCNRKVVRAVDGSFKLTSTSQDQKSEEIKPNHASNLTFYNIKKAA